MTILPLVLGLALLAPARMPVKAKGPSNPDEVVFKDVTPGEKPAPEPTAAEKWNAAEHVFTGSLVLVVPGPVAESYPPIYNYTLHFKIDKVLRGALKTGDTVKCHYAARQVKPPVFQEEDKPYLVAASRAQGTYRVDLLEAATEARVKEVSASTALPPGWRSEDGRILSPWTGLGAKAWTARMPAAQGLPVCAATGRPALGAAGAMLGVEAVPPEKAIQWTNPDGDGLYKVTVTNPTDKPLTVPALLSQGGKILWNESLVILCQGKAYACSGCGGVSGDVEPTVLAPGQSVSTTVNALALEGPAWPRGGYRIEFRFCLGEQSQTKSFYYLSKHHDKVRAAAKPG